LSVGDTGAVGTPHIGGIVPVCTAVSAMFFFFLFGTHETSDIFSTHHTVEEAGDDAEKLLAKDCIGATCEATSPPPQEGEV